MCTNGLEWASHAAQRRGQQVAGEAELACTLRSVDVAHQFVDAFAPAPTRELYCLLKRARSTNHRTQVFEGGAADATQHVLTHSCTRTLVCVIANQVDRMLRQLELADNLATFE